MQKIKINQGWQFWTDGQEQKKQDITLPHDAMILEARQPDLDKGNATGFYPGGKCQRRCGFVVFRRTENVEKWRVKVYSL